MLRGLRSGFYRVDDLDAAKAWYEELLGWPESGLENPDSQWPGTFAYFEDAWTFVMDLFSGQFLEPA